MRGCGDDPIALTIVGDARDVSDVAVNATLR
jgi:hypothetical protein